MIRPLRGWMLVAPLQINVAANDQLRVGRLHSIGDLNDAELQAAIPFAPGDRLCWIESVGPPTHVLNETLLLVPLNKPVAYEPHDDQLAAPERVDAKAESAAEREYSVKREAGRMAE